VTPEYAAGFIDGEGCIRICIQQRRWRNGRINNISHRLVVEVANVHPGVIRQLRDCWGGRIDLKAKARLTPCWYWRIWGHDAAAMLREILPHMIVKYDEAVLALEFMEKGQFRKKGRLRVLTDEVLALREDYKRRISLLHSRRGHAPNPAYRYVQEKALEVV